MIARTIPGLDRDAWTLVCSIVSAVLAKALFFFVIFGEMVEFEGSAEDYCDLLHELKEYDRLLLLLAAVAAHSLSCSNDTFDLKAEEECISVNAVKKKPFLGSLLVPSLQNKVWMFALLRLFCLILLLPVCEMWIPVLQK
ncbi:hypothetical protein K457DRAFT_851044 [Linnemannia elongata AG-77]|uniref:Uncharacterized protein n=1 Tax=Linnemannia elongata AG-77 TaxID=1314771 RepID=A0A197JI72_9FUNG|nr:hypothetical protein K457DRAFT_851044 [Linnemannia elongata AG-77]